MNIITYNSNELIYNDNDMNKNQKQDHTNEIINYKVVEMQK